MDTIPEQIWASAGETWDGIEEGTSWDDGLFNRYRQYPFEIEYIRKDKYDDLKKAADELADAVEQMLCNISGVNTKRLVSALYEYRKSTGDT